MSKPGRGAAKYKHGLIKTSLPVVSDIFTIIKNEKIPFIEISRKAGVTTESMRRWRLGIASPNLIDFESFLNSLGYTLKLSPLDEHE